MVASEQSDGGSRKTRGILGCGSNISCCLTPAQRAQRARPCASAGIATINEQVVSEQHQGLRRFFLCWKLAVLLWMSLHFWSLDSHVWSRDCVPFLYSLDSDILPTRNVFLQQTRQLEITLHLTADGGEGAITTLNLLN